MASKNEHPVISAVGRALPPHFVDQETLIAAFREAWSKAHFNVDRLEQLHRAVQVSGRYLALPLEAYKGLASFASRNEAWTRVAVDLGETALREALRCAGLSPSDVDHIFFVSTTGIATPSIDARLVNRLGLRADVRRSPLFGLGCAGGAAAIAREHVRRDVDAFLAAHGVARPDIRHWIAHTGGPRVLEAFAAALELPAGALARSWRSLRETGNLSSASVLFVLGELLDSADAKAGDYGLLLAMGPGFCSELALLQW